MRVKHDDRQERTGGALRRRLVLLTLAAALSVFPFSATHKIAHADGAAAADGTVHLKIADSAPRHVHETGSSFSVNVTPTLAAGDPLDDAIASVTLVPGANPFGTHNTEQARTLLTDGATSYGGDFGIEYDLWGASAEQQYVDVVVDFTGVASVQSLALYGFNMNSYYSMREASITFVGPDNEETTVPAGVETTGSQTVASFATDEPVAAKTVKFRVYTGADGAWKLNLTELDMTGKAPLSTFASVDSISVQPGNPPFESNNEDQAQTILTDGATGYGSGFGVEYDLWGASAENSYAETTVVMDHEALIEQLDLYGYNLNSYYSIKNAEITFEAADGTTQTRTVDGTNIADGLAEIHFAESPGIPAKTIRIKAYTGYAYPGGSAAWKINLTELHLTQQAPDNGPSFELPAVDLTAQWKDYLGQPIGSPIPLTLGQANTIASPPNPQTGYYGLEFRTSGNFVIEDRLVGEPREYGFAVLPPAQPRVDDPDSAFGMVHADLNDPNIGGWSKTLTWQPNGFDAAGWKSQFDWRRQNGWEELPLVLGAPWDSDGNQPIGQAQVDQVADIMAQHLQADPDVKDWELGLEENLHDYDQPYYFDNLKKKTEAIQAAADEANPDAKFIYQFAEPMGRKPALSQFLQSDAAKQFDILALHPYAWPDFPTPETWMQDILDYTRSEMQSNGLDMPIWFTEVGAPHQGNAPGEWFGYGDPGTGSPVQGLSRPQEAVYLNKIYTLGLEGGVQKILWYNYQDAGANRSYPEDHFGVVDHWGFPKPAYLAYVTTRNLLDGKQAAGLTKIGNVWIGKFSGDSEDAYVLWTDPSAAPKQVNLPSLHLPTDKITGIVNTVGTPIALSGTHFTVPNEPIIVTTSKLADAALSKTAADDAGNANAADAVDGSAATAWTAADGQSGHWLSVDLGHPTDLLGSEIEWSAAAAYGYRLEVSPNGKKWTTLVDRSGNTNPLARNADVFAKKTRYIRIVLTGELPGGQVPSIKEWSLLSRNN